MNDNELRDKLAKEIILKESIICSHNEAIHDALESNAITGFNLGWDAARANPLRDEKRLWTENEELRKERDQFREAAEKLAEALFCAIRWTEVEPINKTENEWKDLAIARASLAEYRSKFPKEEK
mgnify:CR=1 FL=1